MTLVWHDWFATSKAGVTAAADAAPERAAAPARARQLRAARARHHEGPGDAAVAQRHVQQRLGRRTRTTRASCRSCSASAPARGYSEGDVRQLARALTGFRNDWTDAGPTRFRYDAEAARPGPKRIYGKRGKFTWQEGVRLVTRHRRHPSSWSRSSGATSSRPSRRAATRAGAGAAVRGGGPRGAAAAGGDPRAPRPLRRGPRMVKPPVVQAAGMLRAVGRGIDTAAWAWLCEGAGQYLFLPPNVAGLGRHALAGHRHVPRPLADGRSTSASPPGSTPIRTRRRARRRRRSWSRAAPRSGARRRSRAGPAGLERYAADTLGHRRREWKRKTVPRARAERAADAGRHLPRLPHD